MFLEDRPYRAMNTDLKGLVRICVDESLAGLEESLAGLDDAQLAAFPMQGCNNIAWIAMHLLQNFNQYAVIFQRGHTAVNSDKFWVINTPATGSENGYPGREEILESLLSVHTAAMESLEEATNEELLGKRHAPDEWQGNALDAYVRATCHATTHLRQIWAIRGALGLTCKKSMPHQLWF